MFSELFPKALLIFVACGGCSMLRIYPVVLDWVASVVSCLDGVARHDRHLADQLRRSSTSVALNLAEGMAGVGAVKANCYRIALREMRESVAAIELAERLGYVRPLGDEAAARQHRIVGTLVRLAFGRK